ncbi:MAG: prolipoprotein diacylglyceryl transferase [bacterium]
MFVREGFWLGPIFIYYYGILIMSGAVAATFLAARLAKRNGEDPETIWDMLPWLLIGGIVGARLWHIFTPPASMVEQGITTMYYLTHPLDAINIRSGGLGIPGAVMGGVFALWLYCRKKKLKMMVWIDMIAPGLALAQAIGRWGNFLNQEVYGAPSSLPWAITIDAAHRVPGYEAYSTYHPLFLYEFLWNLFVMGLLLYIGIQYKDRIKNGDIFRVYMFMYPFARFFLEYLRLDPSPVGNININQTLMAVLMVASVGWMVYTYRDRIKFLNRGKPAVEAAVENNLVLEASGDLEADTDKSETANPETD